MSVFFATLLKFHEGYYGSAYMRTSQDFQKCGDEGLQANQQSRCLPKSLKRFQPGYLTLKYEMHGGRTSSEKKNVMACCRMWQQIIFLLYGKVLELAENERNQLLDRRSHTGDCLFSAPRRFYLNAEGSDSISAGQKLDLIPLPQYNRELAQSHLEPPGGSLGMRLGGRGHGVGGGVGLLSAARGALRFRVWRGRVLGSTVEMWLYFGAHRDG
ncbi:hypothetical protein B0H13DRAFT_1882184 [Mycena leptocephala]|nr:hypothetical protein B0H13DRAFT_1882184 [Mycena leptocephala]